MKLETKLIKTVNELHVISDKPVNGNAEKQRIRFYSLVNHYERLQNRYIKSYGTEWNPNHIITRGYHL